MRPGMSVAGWAPAAATIAGPAAAA